MFFAPLLFTVSSISVTTRNNAGLVVVVDVDLVDDVILALLLLRGKEEILGSIGLEDGNFAPKIVEK